MKLRARARLLASRWGRDVLAVAATACAAIGLGGFAWQLGWLVVAVVLFAAATAGRRVR